MKKHQLQPSGRKLQLLFFGPFVVGVIAMFSIDFSVPSVSLTSM
jgi:hypothetical protein